MKKILVIGNCQAEWIAKYLRKHPDGFDISSLRMLPADIINIKNGKTHISQLIDPSVLESCDLLLTQNHSSISVAEIIGDSEKRAIQFPAITFDGFHPDMVSINSEGTIINAATGPYHSSLAYFGWLNGLNMRDAKDLFCLKIFEGLGYTKSFDSGIGYLKRLFEALDLPFSRLYSIWEQHGCWMHTINHPKMIILASLCNELLSREQINLSNIVAPIDDPFERGFRWGVYPEIADHLNTSHNLRLDSAYSFTFNSTHLKVGGERVVYDLEEFIERSFHAYDLYKAQGTKMECRRLNTAPFQKLREMIQSTKISVPDVTVNPRIPNIEKNNPYRGLPDYQFWRRAVSRLSLDEIDPIVTEVSPLKAIDKIATAGSCFAQHIARRLEASGMNYYVVERGDELTPEERKRRNFGVFSARYGNIYTVRQLCQLFDRVFGFLKPQDECWQRPDGKYVDPFRPEIEPDGFNSPEQVNEARTIHLQSVKNLFENLDVFIFTLGLTEAWRNKVDGCVYPLAPGVVAGAMNPEIHEFVNFGVQDIIEELNSFIRALRTINPKARVILTVSPVALMATYEKQHVLLSNTYSKSVLRVVATEVCKANTECEYFPSYEIITGAQTRGAFYEDDLRSIKQEGVDQVMKIFLKHYTEGNVSGISIPKQGEALPAPPKVDPTVSEDASQAERLHELEELNQVVCEEELLDQE